MPADFLSDPGGAAPAPEISRERDLKVHVRKPRTAFRHLFHSRSRNQTADSISDPQLVSMRPSGDAASFTQRSIRPSVDLSDGVAPVKGGASTDFASSGRRLVPTVLPSGGRYDTGSDSSDSFDGCIYGGSPASRSEQTGVTSVITLPALQSKFGAPERDALDPVAEDDPSNYDLVAPAGHQDMSEVFSLETRGEQMFSVGHLQAIFDDPALLVKFTTFLSQYRSSSLPLLIYYLDSLKALRAIQYTNAILEALDPVARLQFTSEAPPQIRSLLLETKAKAAFEQMAREDLPAYVTKTFVNVVSLSIHRRITGTLPPHLREASEGLAEVFCLSDPSRMDNPIVFASEEFHRTTQYGVGHAIGRNCRFLQGPRTNRDSVRRIKEAIVAGRDHTETYINYRRDGSPFMNLFMCAPLRDSRGTLRYYIGAQVDVSGLAKEATDLEGLQRYLDTLNDDVSKAERDKDEFQALSEMFNHVELDTVRRYGGRMHREHLSDIDDSDKSSTQRPRLLLKDPSDPQQLTVEEDDTTDSAAKSIHGKLTGVYSHYLLVRPYPSLRILFTSPSLRVPGMLQSHFMDRIGSSDRVRDELLAAMAEGRGVTAKVRWVTRNEKEGRNRWIHCTPLLGHNGNIGVWMVVLVDDDDSRLRRRFRPAPPVASNISDQASQTRYDDIAGRAYSGRTSHGGDEWEFGID